MNRLKDKKVYLAAPYSHENSIVERARFDIINHFTGQLMHLGVLVFSPISHTHPIAITCGLPTDAEFWLKYDETFVEWAEILVILNIDGWETSKGVAREVEIFNDGTKPLYLWNPWTTDSDFVLNRYRPAK